MIEVRVEKNNIVTNFTIINDIVTVTDSNGNLIRTVKTESTNEKATLRNIIYSNYDSYINVLSIN